MARLELVSKTRLSFSPAVWMTPFLWSLSHSDCFQTPCVRIRDFKTILSSLFCVFISGPSRTSVCLLRGFGDGVFRTTSETGTAQSISDWRHPEPHRQGQQVQWRVCEPMDVKKDGLKLIQAVGYNVGFTDINELNLFPNCIILLSRPVMNININGKA